jgi:hypothetical protein
LNRGQSEWIVLRRGRDSGGGLRRTELLNRGQRECDSVSAISTVDQARRIATQSLVGDNVINEQCVKVARTDKTEPFAEDMK